MKKRWALGFGGGALAAACAGACASSLSSPALNAISLGTLVSLVTWIAVWVVAMASQRLGRFALGLFVVCLGMIAFVLGKGMLA